MRRAKKLISLDNNAALDSDFVRLLLIQRMTSNFDGLIHEAYGNTSYAIDHSFSYLPLMMPSHLCLQGVGLANNVHRFRHILRFNLRSPFSDPVVINRLVYHRPEKGLL